MPTSRLALVLAAVAAAAGCGGGGATASDAAADRAPADTGSPGDALSAPLALAIAVTGCVTLDATTTTCHGAAPLRLSFSPVTSGALDTFRWDFGDGSPASAERAPSHTYFMAMQYDVTVSASGDAGVISSPTMTIDVAPAALGGACDADTECA